MDNRLTTLAASINEGISKLNAYLSECNLPCPSFEPSGSQYDHFNSDAEGIAVGILDATQELHDLVRNPRDLPFDHHFTLIPVHDVITNFGVARKVPLDGDISYADLAAATGVERGALTRLLRYGIVSRIFQEKRPGFVSHSAYTKLWVEDKGTESLNAMIRDDIFPGRNYIADALEKWPGADEPHQTAFQLAEKSSQPTFFHQLAQTPGRAERFANSMSYFSRFENIAEDYPWEDLRSGTLVESGGSQGHTAFKIAEKHPALKIVVQDMPEVIAFAKTKEGRQVSFMEHDFFKEQPVKGADAYMIRWCLHAWSDKYAARILQALLPAMKEGTKVLVVEAVTPPFGSIPHTLQCRLW